MKILLIDPPFKRFTRFVNYYFPMGLGYLAAALKKEGFKEVLIYEVDGAKKSHDIDFSDEYRRLNGYVKGLQDDDHEVWKEVLYTIEDYRPDIVGITVMTTKFGSALKVAKIAKKYDKDCCVVTGGPHATVCPELTMKSENVDFVVRGEGEEVFLELVKAIQNCDRDFKRIKGISYREDGKIVHNIPQKFLDLRKYPMPSRESLINIKNYSSEDMGIIQTMRGCPFGCTFCSEARTKVRYRSLDDVMDEIRYVYEEYGTRQISFRDDTFLLNKRRVIELCNRIKEKGLKINWDCTGRVGLIDEEILDHIKSAGCNLIKIGVESGSERILKAIDKKITLEEIRKTANLLNKYKIFWSAYFMAGLPMENEEDLLKTYDFLRELNPYYGALGVYQAFPGTRLFEVGVESGLLHSEVGLDHFSRVNPKDYYFKDPKRRVSEIPSGRFDELINFMMDGFHEHNTQWKNMLRRAWARRLVYAKDYKLLFSDIKKALTWKKIITAD